MRSHESCKCACHLLWEKRNFSFFQKTQDFIFFAAAKTADRATSGTGRFPGPTPRGTGPGLARGFAVSLPRTGSRRQRKQSTQQKKTN